MERHFTFTDETKKNLRYYGGTIKATFDGKVVITLPFGSKGFAEQTVRKILGEPEEVALGLTRGD